MFRCTRVTLSLTQAIKAYLVKQKVRTHQKGHQEKTNARPQLLIPMREPVHRVVNARSELLAHALQKMKKSRSRALLPVPVLDDEEDEGPQRPSMGRAKSRKKNRADVPNLQVPEKVHEPPHEVVTPYAYFTSMFTAELIDMRTFQTNL